MEGVGKKGMGNSSWTIFIVGRLKRRLLMRISRINCFLFSVENPIAQTFSLSRPMSSTACTGLDDLDEVKGHEQTGKSSRISIEIVTTLRSSRQALERGRRPDRSTYRPLHPLVSIRVAPSTWSPKLGLVSIVPCRASPFKPTNLNDLKTAPFSAIFSDVRNVFPLNDQKPEQGYSNDFDNGLPATRQTYSEQRLVKHGDFRPIGKSLSGRLLVDQICHILRCSDRWDRLNLMDIKLDSYHVGEVLKRQEDVVLALSFFHWATEQPGFEHNLSTYHIMIRILTLSRDFDHALRLVHNMSQAGCKPNVVTFTILISGFGAANQLEPALEVFKHMREVGSMPNVVTYNVLLSIHARTGMHEEAWELFKQMQLEGVEPNAAIYNSLINCLRKAGLVSAATKLFSEMKTKSCVPDVITYTIIIGLHSKAGLYQEAIEYYREMQQAGLKPDIVVLCAVMDCLGKAGDVSGAFRIFEDLKSGGYRPDAVAYTNIIDIHAKSGFYEQAVQLFNEMREMGVQPNTINYNSILDCLGKAGNVQAAYMLFQQMKSLGCVPDLNTYGMMMCLHAKLGLQDICLQFFEELQEVGLHPNSTILVAMIDCLGKTGNFDAAFKLFSEIKDQGYSVDVVCYTRMIDICAKCGHYEKAMELFSEMQQAGLEPNIFTYNALIHCLGKFGNPVAAHNLFHEMQQRGCKPNIVTYNTLMDMFSKAGKPHRSLEIFTNLDVQPDSVTFITMMEALSKAGHPEEAEHTFKKMQEAGHDVQRPAYNILIDVWGRTGNIVKVDYWYKELLKSGLNPDEVTGKTLIVAYLRAHHYDSVTQAIRTFSSIGFSVDCSVAAILLQHCAALGKQEHIDAMLTLMSNLEHPPYAFLHKVIGPDTEDIQAECRSFFDSLQGEDKESKMMFLDALIWFLYSQHYDLEAGYVWDYAVANNFFPQAVTKMPSHWAMDFHSMSVGTAVVALTRTLANFREMIDKLETVPHEVSIITGWGRGSKVPGSSTVKQTIQEKLDSLGSPFYLDEMNLGCFVCSGDSFVKWIQHH